MLRAFARRARPIPPERVYRCFGEADAGPVPYRRKRDLPDVDPDAEDLAVETLA